MSALIALALAGLVPGGQPPPAPVPPGPSPDAVVHHHIHVSGRLRPGATLIVSAYESYDLPNAPGFTPQPSSLCYQHGTSRRLCTTSQVSMWTVRLRSGDDQYLTVQLDGKTVARIVYRERISGPPAPPEAPRAWTLPPAPDQPDESDPRSAAGGLSGPATIKVGQQAYFWGPLGAGTLCYRHGTSRVSCTHSARDSFYLTVEPGRDQYFVLRLRGKEVSRLTYHHVS